MSPEQEIIDILVEAMRRARSEADLKAGIEEALRRFAEQSGWPSVFHPCPDGTLVGSGRANTLFDRLYVKYEKPGRLKPDAGDPAYLETADHLRNVLQELGQKKSHLQAAVCTDGRYILFLICRHEAFGPLDLQPFAAESARGLLKIFQALHRKAICAEELDKEVGPAQPFAQQAVQTLLHMLGDRTRPRIKIMFQEWHRISGIISGEETLRSRENARAMVKLLGAEKGTDPAQLLYCLETFHALFVKLLAVEFLYSTNDLPSLSLELARLDDHFLKAKLSELEQGRLFSILNVTNMLAGDLFSWHLESWNSEAADMVRDMARIISQYEPTTAIHDPPRVGQLFKEFYACFLPRGLRHTLGMVPTPQWLAERLLNQAGYDGNPDKRILDPACGSGALLAESIGRVHGFCRDHPERYPDPSAILAKILDNVAGFDVCPLAAIVSRANYILALGPLVRNMKAALAVPVYLADSVLGPREQVELFRKGYLLHTSVGDFLVPSEFIKGGKISRLSALMEDCVQQDSAPETFLERVRQTCTPDQGPVEAAGDLTELYRTLVDLDRQGRDRIWPGIIHNAFAARMTSKFDYLVSDAPRLAWKQLPAEYRNALKPLWEHAEGLAKSHHVEYEAGKQRRDVSILFTCEIIEAHLKNKGKLAVAISRSILKNHPNELFRTFRLEKNRPIRAVHVDDVTDLLDVESGREGTDVIVLQRGAETQYPVPYTLWRVKSGEKIVPEATLDEVFSVSLRSNLHARPVEKESSISPWITARASTLDVLERVMGPAAHQPKASICAGTGGVYVVRLISERADGLWVVENIPEAAKRKKKNSVQTPVEPTLLCPVCTARNVSRWHCRPEDFFILPYRGHPQFQEISLEEMRNELPWTFAYLSIFEDALSGRAGHEQFLQAHPFYALENAGPDLWSRFKVICSATGAGISACVVESREAPGAGPIVPLHPLTMFPCEKAEEAYYLSAVCNSLIMRVAMQIFMTPDSENPDATQMLKCAAIPRFHGSNQLHRELAELALQAHRLATLRLDNPPEAQNGKKQGFFLHEIEEQMEDKVALLWNVSSGELLELERSLKEPS